MNFNPFVLKRENNLEKSAVLYEFKTDHLLTIYQLEKTLNNLQTELIHHLNEILKNTNRPIKLDSIRHLRRNKRHRFVLNIAKLLEYVPEAVGECMKRFESIYYKHQKLLEKAESMYEHHLREVRQGFKNILEENPSVLNGLLMVNHKIYSKLVAYLNTPVSEHRSRHRKLDGTLYNFINRAALKTSPFSDITNIGRVQLSTKNDATFHYKKSVSLNYTFIYKLVQFYYIQSDLFLEKISYTIPPFSISSEDGQHYIDFLSKKETVERTKVFLSEEQLGKLRITESLANLFHKKGLENYISFEEIHASIGEHIPKDRIITLIRNYVKVGLLTPAIGFDEKNCDALIEDMKRKLSGLIDEKDYTKLIHYISNVYSLSKQVSSATDITTKHQYFKELSTLLQEIKNETGIYFAPHEVFYEDGYFPGLEHLERSVIEKFLHPMKQIQLFSLIFDTSVRMRLEFAARLKKIATQEYVEMDDEFFSVLFGFSKDMRFYWENPAFIANDQFQSEELKELDRIKSSFIQDLNALCRDSSTDTVDVKDLVDTYVKRIPDKFRKEKGLSTSVFAQLNKGKMIINALYEGQERYLARFMNYFNDFLNEDKEYRKFIEEFYDDNNYYELTDTYGFNGNVKEQRLKRECYTVGAGTRRYTKEGNENLHMVEEFKVKVTNQLFTFIDKNNKEAKVCFRGSLTPAYMPGYIAILLQLFTSGSMYYKLGEMVDEIFIPRMTYDNLILSRRKVRLNVIKNEWGKKERERDFEYYKRINITFSKYKLDKKFFIVLDRSTQLEDEKLYNFKPLFIDIENPLSLKVLEKEVLEKFDETLYDIFFMEEYLSNTGPYAKELNFEIYQKGE